MNNKQVQWALKKNTWDTDTDLVHLVGKKHKVGLTSNVAAGPAPTMFLVGELKYEAVFLYIRRLKCDEW